MARRGAFGWLLSLPLWGLNRTLRASRPLAQIGAWLCENSPTYLEAIGIRSLCLRRTGKNRQIRPLRRRTDARAGFSHSLDPLRTFAARPRADMAKGWKKVDSVDTLKAELLPRIPRAALHVLPGVGHLSRLESSQELARLIGDFADARATIELDGKTTAPRPRGQSRSPAS